MPDRPSIFEPEHEAFRETVARLPRKEVVPFHDAVGEGRASSTARSGRKAGAPGLLVLRRRTRSTAAAGVKDFRYNVVLAEEMTRRGRQRLGLPACTTTSSSPTSARSATDEQKQRWLPGPASPASSIAAIAMTEPGAGSRPAGHPHDARSTRATTTSSTAQKTFISNGILADLVIVVARTDPDAGHQGISLLVVERGMEGFERGRNLDKIGHARPGHRRAVLRRRRGAEGEPARRGGLRLRLLMTNLPQERLSIAAIGGRRRARRVLETVPGLRQGARGVRQADREVPAQPLRARRDGHRGPHRAGLRQRLRRPAQRRRARHRRSRRWRSGGPPSCRRRSSTTASSSTAATAT